MFLRRAALENALSFDENRTKEPDMGLTVLALLRSCMEIDGTLPTTIDRLHTRIASIGLI